jgi:3'-phosphoadenosine 5'-phosphosulfate sulfotransferase (PAPS reductase)/FAD synthetase
MDEVTKETYLMYAETKEYQRAVEQAQGIIRAAIEKHDKTYVAFSGGKDSTVMLHLVLQQYPDVLVEHWDYGPYYMPRDIEQETLDIARNMGANNIRIDTSHRYEEKKREPANIFYRVFFGKVQKELISEGITLGFIGIRSHESGKRKRKINGSAFRWNDVLTECYPVHHFTTRDIWAYIASHDLPYCSHYDQHGPLLGWENVRFCTYFDPEFAHMGCSNVDGVLMPEFRNV